MMGVFKLLLSNAPSRRHHPGQTLRPRVLNLTSLHSRLVGKARAVAVSDVGRPHRFLFGTANSKSKTETLPVNSSRAT